MDELSFQSQAAYHITKRRRIQDTLEVDDNVKLLKHDDSIDTQVTDKLKVMEGIKNEK